MDISAVSSSARYQFAKNLIGEAGQMALAYFSDLSQLEIEKKGHQDLVSQADKNVEIFIREHISAQFPDDGIIGEEGGSFIGTSSSDSGYRWVIDPIDGTANFVSGIPAWTVVIALVRDNVVIAGFIFDPVQNELFTATDGGGAFAMVCHFLYQMHRAYMTVLLRLGFQTEARLGLSINWWTRL